MGAEGSFLVEEFINAITTQLDRVQDSLRLKAVNRPLTYALKDIALDLQVFVDVDPQGNVRFRSSAPNEEGASTIRLGFTTITRPMIEENTVSLAMSRSPNLDELGLGPEEMRRLEQFGVRNAAQLQNLGKQTGATSVARMTGIPIDRLKAALAQGKPLIRPAVPVKSAPAVQPPPAVRAPKPQPPVFVPPRHRPSVIDPIATRPRPNVEAIKVAPGTRHMDFVGSNLFGDKGLPEVRLNNRPLNITDADDDYLKVEIPENPEAGMLEILLPDGEQMLYQLSFDDESYDDNGISASPDSWEPNREY
ncbi:MAG: hypothetical protein H7070_13495 [Saprospiraceae bacterium]|nr:hypothetical protein [Pyrinomonadaceae bacterium]